jgi:hypothetical protein
MRKTRADGFSVPEAPLFLAASIRGADGAAAGPRPSPFGGKLDPAQGPFQSMVSNILQISCGKGGSSRGPEWIYAAAASSAVSSSLDGLPTRPAGAAPGSSGTGGAQEAGARRAEAGDAGGPLIGSGGGDLVLKRPAAVAFAPAAAPAGASAGGRAFTLRRPALVAFPGGRGGADGGGAAAGDAAEAKRNEMGARQRGGLQLPRLDLPGLGARLQLPHAPRLPGQQRSSGSGGLAVSGAAVGGSSSGGTAAPGTKSALVSLPAGGGAASGGASFVDHAGGGVWEIAVINGTTVARLKLAKAKAT